MTFSLKDVLGAKGEREIRKLALPEDRCPTGKTAYASKDAAREHLKKVRGHGSEKHRRSPMGPFRCGFCGKIHLGHKRGAVL